MSQADRDKWNARYREGADATRTNPSVLLAEWLPKPVPFDEPRRSACA